MENSEPRSIHSHFLFQSFCNNVGRQTTACDCGNPNTREKVHIQEYKAITFSSDEFRPFPNFSMTVSAVVVVVRKLQL